VLHSITLSWRDRGDRCTGGNKSSYPEGAVCERFLTKKASAAFTRLTSACSTKRTCQGRLTMSAPEGKTGRAARARTLPFLTQADIGRKVHGRQRTQYLYWSILLALEINSPSQRI
jgi:hypothetical protein